jgi:hypothetical protein
MGAYDANEGDHMTTKMNARWAAALIGCAATLLAPGAGAQQPAPSRDSVAELRDLKGNVLVSRESGLTAGSESQQLANGTRVITTANSEVVVVFDNGCRVHLRENQRLDVDSRKPCAALVVQSLPVAVAAAPVAGHVVPALIGIGILLDTGGGGSPSTPVSPN